MVMLNQGGNYLRVSDVKDGDVLTIKDEGTWVESKYEYPDGNKKQDFVMTMALRATEYNVRVNKLSRDELLPVFGNDTSKWVGKEVAVKIENYRTLNKQGIILIPVMTEEQVKEKGWDD